jgi:hypothetical protein
VGGRAVPMLLSIAPTGIGTGVRDPGLDAVGHGGSHAVGGVCPRAALDQAARLVVFNAALRVRTNSRMSIGRPNR